MAGGHVWQRGACMAGGVHGRGHVWQRGSCMAERSMRGRGVHGMHALSPLNRMTDTCKTLPCRELCLWVVIIDCAC